MRVSFFGAAGEVTGSCHLVQAGDHRVLLDCGLIQGGRDEARRNAEPFGFDVAGISSMVLSHAHIDHVGRLPLLYKRGYRGPIWTHRATAELSRIMLEDAARLTASDMERGNRQRERRGLKPLAPLYGMDDVERVLKQLRPIAYDEWHELLPGIKVRLSDAGHIIGAAIIELWSEEAGSTRKLVFSGDIGPNGTPILRDPTPVTEADLVLMESTYGDRLHRQRSDTVTELGAILRDARARGGNVLIPAFAVGRTQELLYAMAEHYDEWDLASWRLVLDSPMAAKVSAVYEHHTDLFDPAAQAVWKSRNKPFSMPNLRMVSDAKESMALNEIHGGQIIIAGSGMCNGGRIVHHLRHNLWRESAHVVFVGYQAAGTLGRELVDGKKTVRVFGEPIVVKAQRHTLGGLSAHADQAGLMEWYGHFAKHPPVYLVHGEDAARETLAAKLRERYGARAELARPAMTIDV